MAREAKVLITSSNNIGAGIKSAVKDLTSLESNAVRIGKKIQQAFSAAAVLLAVKQVVNFGIESVKAFGESERAMTQLKTALGGSDSAFGRMNDLIADMGKKTLASKDDVEALVAEMASLGKSEDDIKKMTDATIALSNVTGMNLDSAFKAINGSFAGTTKELKKLVPEIGTLTREQLAAGGAVDLLNEKLGAISDSMAGGISQRLKNLSDDFGDLQENIGEKMLVAFSPMVTFIDSVISGWNSAYDAHKKYDDALAGGDTVMAAAIKRLTDLQKEYKKLQDKKAISGFDASGIMSASIDEGLIRALEYQIIAAKKALDILNAIPSTPLLATTFASSPSGSTAPVGEALVLGIDTAFQGWNYESTIAPIIDDISQEFYDAATRSEPLADAAKTFKFSWGDALSSISSRFQEWGKFAESLVGTIFDSVTGSLEGIGAALHEGSLGWDDFGSAALKALAEVLRGLGAQLAAMAVLLIVQLRWVAAAAAVAGSIAAYIAAGWVEAAANELASSSSGASSPSGSPSEGAGASYTGSQAITFNFYNQGNVVGSGGMEELATIINNLITRNARYA